MACQTGRLLKGTAYFFEGLALFILKGADLEGDRFILKWVPQNDRHRQQEMANVWTDSSNEWKYQVTKQMNITIFFSVVDAPEALCCLTWGCCVAHLQKQFLENSCDVSSCLLDAFESQLSCRAFFHRLCGLLTWIWTQNNRSKLQSKTLRLLRLSLQCSEPFFVSSSCKDGKASPDHHSFWFVGVRVPEFTKHSVNRYPASIG